MTFDYFVNKTQAVRSSPPRALPPLTHTAAPAPPSSRRHLPSSSGTASGGWSKRSRTLSRGPISAQHARRARGLGPIGAQRGKRRPALPLLLLRGDKMAAAAGGAEGRSPPSGLSPRPGSPPSPGWGSAVVVLSSDSEPEVVPLAERVRRRLPRGRPSAEGSAALGEGLCGSGQRPAAGGGSQAGTGGVLGAEVRPWGGANGAGEAERAAPGLPEAAPTEPEARPGGSPPSGGSAETSPVPKRRKYSQKEREAMCQAAWQRRKEREARKRQQEEEKERKKTLAKILKAQRPGECQKYITVVLDPGASPGNLRLPCAGSWLWPWKPDPRINFSYFTGRRWCTGPCCLAVRKLFLCG